MSRDPSGFYTIPPLGGLNPVVGGTPILTTWANPTLGDIAAALSDSLSRSGKGGMAAPLVMNGYKITSIGPAQQAGDVPQAIQVRDSRFHGFTGIFSDASGNNYTATAVMVQPPQSGTRYLFGADKNNTGPMTLSVNGSAAIPIQVHGIPVPPGLILAGMVVEVIHHNFVYNIIGITSAGGTVNSVQSTDAQLISVVNDAGTGVATLTPHANVPGGMVKLDGSTKVPVAQLPFTDIHYVGIWDASGGTLPATGPLANGDFFIITVAGTLTIFRVTAGNVYTAQSTAVVVGDAIILRKGSVDANQPDGWYFDPGAARPAVAGTVSVSPTSPLFTAFTDLQAWLNAADPAIAARLPLAGGIMSGPIVQPALPSLGTHLANRQYVDNVTSSLVGVLSFNTRTGTVALTSSDVTSALGYTPFSTAGGTITGSITATNNIVAEQGVGALYFRPAYFINDTAPTSLVIDFFNGQSQRIGLTGNTVITAINNIPQGSILRLIITSTNFNLTWPGTVMWPLDIAPSLDAGPFKGAVVALEQFATGGSILASATIY